ncbi:hypothetical protein OIU78_008924 [Salix suchowensis]|nr:hypothetical protein OIU78_008924 [Salix suchowensis]
MILAFHSKQKGHGQPASNIRVNYEPTPQDKYRSIGLEGHEGKLTILLREEIIRPFPAAPKDEGKFHSNEYVEILSSVAPGLLTDPELGMQFARLRVGDVCQVFDGSFFV